MDKWTNPRDAANRPQERAAMVAAGVGEVVHALGVLAVASAKA